MEANEDLAFRYQVRREAAPVLAIALAVLVALAFVSWAEGWKLLHFVPWWTWLLLAVPELVLLADLMLGAGLGSTRRLAFLLLGILVLGNLLNLTILVAGLVTTSTKDLGGGELLLTAAAIWITNVVVFGLWFWELDDGGPVARAQAKRGAPDFQFPQDDNPTLARPGWAPDVWDYVYVAVTNSIAFSPTDAMPLTRTAKGLMALGSLISVGTVLLVAARAVNVLGT